MSILATSSGMARRAAGPARVAMPAAAAITVITLKGCSPHSPAVAVAAPAAATVTRPTATATVTGPPASAPAAAPGLVPGGQPVRFRVTITNNSGRAYSNILPLVSLGHCSCTASTLFPKGTLQERASTSSFWPAIPYDVEGFGADYLDVAEPGGIQMISPGGTATFEYRVALSPATSAQVTRGTGATLIRLPGHSPVGRAPSASAPVDVQSGSPPA
jgi:hypothetical protein